MNQELESWGGERERNSYRIGLDGDVRRWHSRGLGIETESLKTLGKSR